MLHYQNLKREPPAAHHSLLIDAGAQWSGYASDITRTFVAGSPDQSHRDFAALIKAMDQAQQSLCGQVRAGVEWADIHRARASGRSNGSARSRPDQLRCG